MRRLVVAYISHPYGGRRAQLRRIREICRGLAPGVVCIAPPLFLPGYLSEGSERRLALRHCRELVRVVDVVLVVEDGVRTPGMRSEIRAARRLGKPVVIVRRRKPWPAPGASSSPRQRRPRSIRARCGRATKR